MCNCDNDCAFASHVRLMVLTPPPHHFPVLLLELFVAAAAAAAAIVRTIPTVNFEPFFSSSFSVLPTSSSTLFVGMNSDENYLHIIYFLLWRTRNERKKKRYVKKYIYIYMWLHEVARPEPPKPDMRRCRHILIGCETLFMNTMSTDDGDIQLRVCKAVDNSKMRSIRIVLQHNARRRDCIGWR